jgi:Holliday junction resolvase-like predicted endonuclease
MENHILNENAVVAAVVNALPREGYTVLSFATTSPLGVDIVAKHGSRRLYVEAKGVTSSKPSSSRYGKVYDRSQMFISIAAAFATTAALRSAHPYAEILIAVPDALRHRAPFFGVYTFTPNERQRALARGYQPKFDVWAIANQTWDVPPAPEYGLVDSEEDE